MIDAFGRERCELIGQHVIDTGSTVRSAARFFGVSKSTVHKDVTKDLRTVNAGLYLEVGNVLQQNKNERHLRGGEATRRKYKKEGKTKATL